MEIKEIIKPKQAKDEINPLCNKTVKNIEIR